ncbi:hypothetical protein Tco_0060950 [Tanacetum coccineum]
MSTTQASSQLIVAQLVHVYRQYEIARSNMEVDLDSLPCLVPSKIIGEILKRNSLKDAFTLSASAPVIYMQQLWYTLQLADSKESFNFKLEQHDVEFTMDDLRTLLNLPQETDNIHVGLHCAKCSIDVLQQASLLSKSIDATLQIFYSIINGCHVDYVKLIWDGIHYQLMNPSSKHKVVWYPRFTKLIIQHTLAKFPDIPRRTNKPQHTIDDDAVVGFIIASGNVEGKGMRISNDLLTKDIRGIASYKLYDDDFNGINVPTTQPSPAISTQGTRRKTSNPRTPNRNIVEGDEKEVDETFVDSFILSQEDLGTMIYPGSHKESPNEEKEE